MVKKRELTVEVWAKHMWNQLDISFEEMIMYEAMQKGRGIDMLDVRYEVQMANAWLDSGMQVYEFDRDFSDSIIDEKWVDLLPDCIVNRPHDCFYMRLPCHPLNDGVVVNIVDCEDVLGFDPSLFPGVESGKGVYLGGDTRFAEADARAVVNTGEKLLCIQKFAIPKTPELMFDDTDMGIYPTALMVNGLAYLCSANADITPSYTPQKGLKRNNAKRRSQATWHDVGYRIGAELRSYKRAESVRGEHQGGTVRPHMRRAHWHHYWTGPRNGERKLVLKWLAPTMVNVGSDGIESATGHKVRRG